ncbi:MAG: universal stress protein [Gemmatirosa sp.]
MPGPDSASRTVVAPVDGTPEGERGLVLAVVAARRLDATLELFHVVRHPEPLTVDPPVVAPTADARLQEEARRALIARGHPYLAELQGRTRAASAVRTRLAEGEPTRAILARAREHDAVLLVLPTHARGMIASALLGSVALPVARDAAVPVLLLPPGSPAATVSDTWSTSVLIATAGAASAERALAGVVALCAPHTQATILTVVDPMVAMAEALPQTPFDAPTPGDLAPRLRAAGLAVVVEAAAHGRPAHAITETAVEEGTELLALATHPRHGTLDRLIEGSVAASVVRHAPCPVWLTHADL